MRRHEVRPTVVHTDDLDPSRLAAIRQMLDRAFDDFDDHDWDHSLGGLHVFVEIGELLVAHAAIVERPLEIDDRPFRTGYVEAVATDPSYQGRGFGSAVMHAVGEQIRRHFAIGALCTGLDGYYERFGWERWTGPTHVRHADGTEPSPDDDGLIFVLRHGPSAEVELTSPISCEARAGDDW
jgi:aminoglycoside 2'-N-acetyltransferase I